MKRKIIDRLYDGVEYTAQDLRLFQTDEMTRLRRVSLSVVPYWILPAGICATKFEHSVGAAHLARIVGKRKEFREIAKDLHFATLLHDLGTPPFSHATEEFQMRLLGKNHEEYVEDVLYDAELTREVKRQGGNIDRILKYITGEEMPLSDLVNGSIDLDNLDNTLRFGLSMGLINSMYYSPEKLARAYRLRDGKVALQLTDLSDLKQWERCRKDVYEFVYSQYNLAPAMMLYRALEFAAAENDLHTSFFYLTDAAAFDYLLESGNKRTRWILDEVSHWRFFERVYEYATDKPNDELAKLCGDSIHRGILSNELAEVLRAEPEKVSVFLRKDKGHKDIHLPVIDGNGKVTSFDSESRQRWLAQVYVYGGLVGKMREVEEFMKEKIEAY